MRDRFSRADDAFTIGFIVVWVFAALATLAFWGVVVWAIIEVVQWLTAK